MRTESPVGGGPSCPRSPPPSSDYVFDQMTAKSPRDVDAAMVIAGLSRVSGAASCRSESTIDRHRVVDTAVSDDRQPTARAAEVRFAHIKTAVMPERHSFVQKALKRKIESRSEPTTMSSSSSFGCQSTEAVMRRHESISDAGKDRSIMKAIESERGYFDSVKRCRMSEVEAVLKSEDVGGRFVRTGQPCRSNDDVCTNVPLYVDVARYVKREDASPSETGSSNGYSCVGRLSVDGGEFVRHISANVDNWVRQRDRYSPVLKQDPNVTALLPVATLPLQKFCENSRVDELSKAVGDGNVAGLPMSVGSVLKNRVTRGTDFRHIPQQPSGCVTLSNREHPRHHDSRVHHVDLNSIKKRDNLSAYYSLGRQHASTLTTPARVPVMNGQKTSNKTTQRVESRMLYMPGKNENVKFYKSVGPACSTDENKKVRVMDSRTSQKVRSGEFGTLRTLKDFYNKLGQKASVPEKPAFQGRLGPVTNCRPQPIYQSVGTDASSGFVGYADSQLGEEMAIDLSVHSRKMRSDREESRDEKTSRYELLRLGRGARRKSRSCCSSPGMVLDLATRIDVAKSSREQFVPVSDQMPPAEMKNVVANSQRWLVANASSLPSSPFAYSVDQVKQETSCCSAENHWSEQKEGCVDKQAMSSMVKADSRLPLKKRRLLDVGSPSADVTSSSPSPHAEISHDIGEQNVSAIKREYVADDRYTIVGHDSPSLISAIVHGDENGDLPLHVAIAQGNLDRVECILDIMFRLEMSLDCYNSQKQTPLIVAVSRNQPTIIRRLLKGGASPNMVDRNGLSSIHHAAKLTSSECLECLLEHSRVHVDIDATSYSGQTALHMAVQSNNAQAVRILIAAGARIDACDDSSGRTPLLYAFEQNNLAMAKILLANGASTIFPSYSTGPTTCAQRCYTIDVSRLHDICVAADVKG